MKPDPTCAWRRCDRPAKKRITAAGRDLTLCQIHEVMVQGALRHWVKTLEALGISVKKT